MADAVARREARRKRILENASSRLEKITGRKEDISLDYNIQSNIDTSKVVDNDHVTNGCVPTVSVEEFSSILRGRAPINHQNQSQTQSEPTLPSKNDLSGEPDVHSSFVNNTQNKKIKSFLYSKTNILTNKLLIVFLAIAVRCLHSCQMTEMFSNMIFLPLILLEIIICIISPAQESLGMLGAALMLSGLSPNITNSLSLGISTLKKLFLDFSIFLFTFVLTHIAFLSVDILIGDTK